MKTIRFYSYKGGVGRTLLTAHIAKLLAASGKKVVIMDFDFDAPGIPTIFGLDPFTREKGFVGLYLEYQQKIAKNVENYGARSIEEGDKWLQALLEDGKFSKGFATHLETYFDPMVIDNPSTKGWIKLLPCGRLDDKYWAGVAEIAKDSIPLAEFFGENKVLYFLSHYIKNGLNALDIDYLLIDARAGITCFGDISRSIADTEALIFCPNDDTRCVWPQIWDDVKGEPHYKCSRPRIMNKPKFACIVSRMPPELDEDKRKKFKEMEELLTPKKHNANFLGVLPLHSDLKTHLDPKCRLDYTKYSENDSDIVQFNKDVCEILVTLCPEVLTESNQRLPSVEEKAKVFWWETYRKHLEITHINRLFDLYIKYGDMRNSDKTRNIAFKIETFLLFLNKFYDMQSEDLASLPEWQDKSKRNIECQRKIDATLTEAGFQCGEAFGQTLFPPESTDSPADKIKKWCEFDKQAGFGKMEYTEGNNMLTIEKLFIRDQNITKHRDYTAFFTGYVTGVLYAIISPSTTLIRCDTDKESNITKYQIIFPREGK